MNDLMWRYLEQGLPVFPVCVPISDGQCMHHGKCTHPGKTPLVPWLDYQKRLPTLDEFTAWTKKYGETNIGLTTGAFSGIVVLDCDDNEATQYAVNLHEMPPGPRVLTGKPGGTHFWMRHPGREVRNFVGKMPGVDFRGDGGYILVPTSKHVRGVNYRWVTGSEHLPVPEMPEWILDMFVKNGVDIQRNDAGWIANVIGELREGNRNNNLHRIAGWMRRYGATVDDIVALLLPHAEYSGLSRDELRQLAESAKRYQPSGHNDSHVHQVIDENGEIKWVPDD